MYAQATYSWGLTVNLVSYSSYVEVKVECTASSLLEAIRG
jgi:hypothetical protein